MYNIVIQIQYKRIYTCTNKKFYFCPNMLKKTKFYVSLFFLLGNLYLSFKQLLNSVNIN